ncbi:MAG: tyrosine-type recombinase/integrase [Mangrovibacterium sp.]
MISFTTKSKVQTAKLVDYINRFANRSRKDRAYKRVYWNLAKKIAGYEKYRGTTLMTDSLTYQTFEDFIFYLRELFPYRNESIVKFAASLKTVINAAQRDGYKVVFGFVDYRLKKEEPVAVYLTIDEIERVFYLKKLSPGASVVRDRFIIGCCTGLRYSDFSVLSIDNIHDNNILVKTKKTGAKVVIPVHWMIREIINHHGGIMPEIMTSRQNFNKTIKRLCRLAKINSLVLIERTEGHRVVKKKLKKYELVVSHTARRSFATNMKMAGVETAKIMLFTGHKTEDAFFRYIRIGKKENADELASHPFFCKKINHDIV